MSEPTIHRYSKAEAIELMKKGVKMRHRYFSDHEWATMEFGKIVLEDGVRCSPFEFWRWRTNEVWNTDWAKFEEWNK